MKNYAKTGLGKADDAHMHVKKSDMIRCALGFLRRPGQRKLRFVGRKSMISIAKHNIFWILQQLVVRIVHCARGTRT